MLERLGSQDNNQKIFFYLILLALFCAFNTNLKAQTTTLPSVTIGTQTTTLPSITIGTQTWESTNLDVTTYSDGTIIPQVTDDTAWVNLTTGAWCYYNNDSANGAVYGKLYNWYAVAGIYDAASLANPALRKNLAPSGWHVPTDVEWTILTNYLGGELVAGGEMKETGNTHWFSPNTDATNSSIFTALPGGVRYIGSFFFIGYNGNWWSSVEYDSTSARDNLLLYDNGGVENNIDGKMDGFSVRCISNQLSVQDNSLNLNIIVYPNPTSSILYVQSTNNNFIEKIIITDLTGKTFIEQTQNTNQISVEQLASGMYFLQSYSGKGKFTNKFVKE